MEKTDYKLGKLFLLFAGLSIIALPFIVFSGLSVATNEVIAAQVNSSSIIKSEPLDFDDNGKQFFDTYGATTSAYMEGNSTSRTLSYYYSLRQYPGSPPYITHDLKDTSGVEMDCLSCHTKGGFVQAMNKFTPVTPHPQHTACRQCHVKPVTQDLFKDIDWVSVMPPKLGNSALAGSPPRVAHPLQMRENCIACHVGPGTVVPIRVEHPMRGNCRQCHVPEVTAGLFSREIPGKLSE